MAIKSRRDYELHSFHMGHKFATFTQWLVRPTRSTMNIYIFADVILFTSADWKDKLDLA